MPKVKDICNYLFELAPYELALSWDNVGLLVGDSEKNVKTVMLALDITDLVIDDAVKNSAELIISHHPLFIEPLCSITDETYYGRKVIKLINNNISAICMHTNLDAAKGGVNCSLAKALGASVIGYLDEESKIGNVCTLDNITVSDFLSLAKSALNPRGIRYIDSKKPLNKVAICAGSGGNQIENALNLCCDTLVTADVKHHQFIMAKELGINLFDVGHFASENVIINELQKSLGKKFSQLKIKISSSNYQFEEYFI
ncbi:MAG: Nif3-like dinuclear metal center hexameric protein [Ruminococcaceae bacterium]|nr:Nif3-like dinuclear metal center hexameric protein [Oscillospiraceae bacterium]